MRAHICVQWRIDSAATSTYEIGNPPDHRGQACMRKHGVSMRHVARQWVIDSGAVSDWNTGSSPDARALACLRKHDIETDHRARQVPAHVLPFPITSVSLCVECDLMKLVAGVGSDSVYMCRLQDCVALK
ncbi:hypothetical protein Z043_107672 [Scleropages formosus]|uniref:protein-tyrosine-phosphatase n=1 Tax=Scleropages formosus TaxID=113540 RepID=A0A0P7UGC0_SCLFO|nr:hypothetical protein Z043_107672 [Scleropages formosus]